MNRIHGKEPQRAPAVDLLGIQVESSHEALHGASGIFFPVLHVCSVEPEVSPESGV